MISKAKANIPYITDTNPTSPGGRGDNHQKSSLNIIKENIRHLKRLKGKRKRGKKKKLSLSGLQNLKIFFL